MAVIVTGGAGFIGSHVVDALVARGDEVHVVDDLSHGARENVHAAATLHVLDVREPLEALAREVDARAIVHLAAQADVRVSVAEPGRDASINVVGTVNVLEAARLVGARVVFASTGGAIYGECERPAREDDPCLPLSPYGAAKLAGEGYLGAFSRLYGTPTAALRFGNVYGPRQDPHGAGTTSTWATWRERRLPRSMVMRTACSTSAPASPRRCSTCTTYAERSRDRRPNRSSKRRGPANSGAACSTSGAQPPQLASGPRRRSRMALRRRGGGSGFHGRTGGEGARPSRAKHSAVDVSLRHDPLRHDDLLIRPWRTAAIVAGAVAAVELLVLVIIGGALIARPSTSAGAHSATKAHAARTHAAVVVKTPHVAVPAAHLARGKVSVLVLNGNGRHGAAASTASRVSRHGYRIRGVANASSSDFTRSLVMYRRGFEGEGRRLARDLGIHIVGPLDGMRAGQLHGAQAVVVVGA
jgi:hypothetical protein